MPPSKGRLRKIGGRYYAYFYDPERTPREKSYPLRVAQKAAAEKRLRRVERRINDEGFDPWNPDTPAPSAAITVTKATEAFKATRSHLRPKTQRAYAIAMRGLLKHCPPNLTLATLGPSHVRPYVEDPEVSVATRHHRHRHLKAFIRWAQEEKHLRPDQSPLKGIRLPKQERTKAEYLEPEEVERILTAIDAHTEIQKRGGHAHDGDNVWLKDVVLMAVNTGLRLGELCAMRWSWIDLPNELLLTKHSDSFKTKGNAERAVPLVADALEIVKRLQNERLERGGLEDGPVLRNAAGNALRPSYTSKRFKFFCEKARVPDSIHFHSLRHTAASWLVQRGVPLPFVQAILGHGSITTTERYAHHAPDAIRTAMQEAFSPKRSEKALIKKRKRGRLRRR